VKKRKRSREQLDERTESARPPGQIETRFIRVLGDWHSVSIDDPFGHGPIECIISPENKTYRHAHAWEHPELVIDSPAWRSEHDIRLVRVRNVAIRKMAKRILKQRTRRG